MKHYLEDSSISFKEKGVIAYLLLKESKDELDTLKVSKIHKYEAKECYSVIRKEIQNLKEKGIIGGPPFKILERPNESK